MFFVVIIEIQVIHSSIFFGAVQDCRSDSKLSRKDMAKIRTKQTTVKHNKPATVYIILVVYWSANSMLAMDRRCKHILLK